jgi:amino acid transporter
MAASGHYDPRSGEVPSRSVAIGIAIGVLTLVIAVHIFSRRGGIILNNVFAIVKVLLLLVIIFLGIAKGAGAFGGPDKGQLRNFTDGVWTTQRSDLASWSNSLLFCMYAFSGFEQPFYVLAEAKGPRRYFPRYTVIALAVAAVLFVGVNIAFLLAVPKDLVIPRNGGIPDGPDMATLFFDNLFEDSPTARRVMAALIAISIFGNLVVMTFTAARVKQEIAKEGIFGQRLSLFFATSYLTPLGLYRRWKSDTEIDREDLEQAPSAAFLLHWFTSILLILVTYSIKDPRKTYSALVSLYSYVIILLTGTWVSIGLLIIKWRKDRWHWQSRRRYRPLISPVHVILYGTACSIMMVASFTPPQRGSPYHESVTHYKWFIVPSIGISAPLWGLTYYALLVGYQRIKRLDLVVTRVPHWKPDPFCSGEYIQRAELIDLVWQRRTRRRKSRDSDSGSLSEGERESEYDDAVTNGGFAMSQRQAAPRDSN